GTIDRGRDECLGYAQAQLAHAEGEDQGEVHGRTGARIEVRGEGDGAAGVEHGAGGGLLAAAEEEHGAGQQGGDGAGGGQGLDAQLGDGGEVVGGGSADLGGEFGGAGVLELVGVELDGHPLGAGGAEDAAGFLG